MPSSAGSARSSARHRNYPRHNRGSQLAVDQSEHKTLTTISFRRGARIQSRDSFFVSQLQRQHTCEGAAFFCREQSAELSRGYLHPRRIPLTAAARGEAGSKSAAQPESPRGRSSEREPTRLSRDEGNQEKAISVGPVNAGQCSLQSRNAGASRRRGSTV